MANLKVNWLEVSDLSKRTLNNSSDFEKARERYQEIINSIPTCWGGKDAETFVTNANNFLEYLKNDTQYLEDMGNFFKKGSKMYDGVVSEHEEKFKRLNQILQEDQEEELKDGRIG